MWERIQSAKSVQGRVIENTDSDRKINIVNYWEKRIYASLSGNNQIVIVNWNEVRENAGECRWWIVEIILWWINLLGDCYQWIKY